MFWSPPLSPTQITVQGMDRIREGSGFLPLQGNGSAVFIAKGMAVVSEKRTGVYKGRKETKGIPGEAGAEAKKTEQTVTLRELVAVWGVWDMEGE